MLEAVPLIAVTLLLIGCFAYLLASVQLAEIRRDWNDRRCEPLVMMIAHMIPTKPDPNFASDNFMFCMRGLMKASLSVFTGPMLAVFGEQVEATGPIANSMNTLRASAASLFGPLNTIIGALWKKSMTAMYQGIRIFGRIHDAMERVFGIVIATLFAGMASFQGIQNTIGFIIQVCIAILVILVALVIILWFVMWPVIPVVLTAIGVISTTVYGANVSGMAGSFCVAPDTEVKTADGWKKVNELKPGDPLHSGRVEGVLRVVTGPETQCVRLNGVVLSVSHLVWYENAWRPAGECAGATPTDTPAELFCLNTTDRTWMCRGLDASAQLLLRDWEELPVSDSSKIDHDWDTMIYKLLNPKTTRVHLPQGGRGLLGPDTVLYEETHGTIQIRDVHLGDRIQVSPGVWTRVLGVYHDTSESQPLAGPNASTWIWISEKSSWEHISEVYSQVNDGWQLITDSGMFAIWSSEGRYLVRDFTEIGADRIHETYDYTAKLLS